MKPQSTKEAYWRAEGKEFRKHYKQGARTAKVARNFTRKQCNKAMREHGKQQVKEC